MPLAQKLHPLVRPLKTPVPEVPAPPPRVILFWIFGVRRSSTTTPRTQVSANARKYSRPPPLQMPSAMPGDRLPVADLRRRRRCIDDHRLTVAAVDPQRTYLKYTRVAAASTILGSLRLLRRPHHPVFVPLSRCFVVVDRSENVLVG